MKTKKVKVRELRSGDFVIVNNFSRSCPQAQTIGRIKVDTTILHKHKIVIITYLTYVNQEYVTYETKKVTDMDEEIIKIIRDENYKFKK